MRGCGRDVHLLTKSYGRKSETKQFPLRVITSVAGPCPRIVPRNLKILLTQLKSKTKKKRKFGEFSKFPFPSTSRFPYRDKPVAGSPARPRSRLWSRPRSRPWSRPRPAKRGELLGQTHRQYPGLAAAPASDKEQPAESPAESRPCSAGAQPGLGAARPGPSRGELVAPCGGSVAGLRGPRAAPAPCLAGPLRAPQCSQCPQRRDSPRLRRGPSGGCPAALLAAGSGGGSSAFLIYGAALGRRPGNVPSGGFFCRAPSYAPAALHF